ncbi:MmgE/PrpD family protein [Actinomycetota bacterium]
MHEESPQLAPQLSRFAVDAYRGGVPDVVLTDIARRVLDVTGNCLGAFGDDAGRAALSLVRSWAGTPQAGIIGAPSTRVPAAHAALVNGTHAHSLDFDDTHLPSVLHPSASVVPTAIAVAASLGLGGSDVLRAAAVGDEICVRLGMASYDPEIRNSIFFENGLHATSICGTLASAATAAVMIGLDEDGVLNSLAVAASMGAGLLEANRTGGSVKRVHCGWAAHAGISAATLVAEGLTGPPTVLEGRFGFFRAYSEGRFDQAALLGGLGDRWEILQTHFKPYPANHFTHPCIDAALELRRQGVIPADIVSIELGVAGPTLRTIAEPEHIKAAPPTSHAAKFSAPFTVASALHGGGGLGLSHEDFSSSRLSDPEILATASVVRCVEDAQATELFPRAFSAVLNATLSDGRNIEVRVPTSRGGLERPLSDDDLTTKFLLNAEAHLESDTARQLAQTIWGLRDVGSIDEVLRLTEPRTDSPDTRLPTEAE